MWKIIALLGVAVLIVGVGFGLLEVRGAETITASAVLLDPNMDYSGYPIANDLNYPWSFPADHAPHPDFLTEWWYYTGNLENEQGERFGFQFTVFRRAIVPTEPVADSEWRTRQYYSAHFTVSDVARERFFHDERLSRGAMGLAGATIDPSYRVWIEDWQVEGQNPDATEVRLNATMPNENITLDLILNSLKAPVLQGDNGVSKKGGSPDNASYYYSVTRQQTQGTLTIGDVTHRVQGWTWMDREWSTSVLEDGAQGWDWFGLIFDDETELMLGKIRYADGREDNSYGGRYVLPNGESIYLPLETFEIVPLDTWTSPHSGAVYPSGWQFTLDAETLGRDEDLTFTVTPLLKDQELLTTPIYWEGAVRIDGDVSGYGYAELTGYADQLAGL